MKDLSQGKMGSADKECLCQKSRLVRNVMRKIGCRCFATMYGCVADTMQRECVARAVFLPKSLMPRLQDCPETEPLLDL